MSDEKSKITLKPRSLCEHCRSNLIHGAQFKPTDPWMALEVAALLTLITLSLKDKKYLIKYGNDIEGINRISCLGCFLPEKLKEITKTAKETKSIEAVKAIGDAR